jgi:catalase
MLPRWSRRVVIVPVLACAPVGLVAQQAQAPAKSLPQQIANVMVQLAGGIHPGFRFTHAKGIVATGTFTPAPTAKSISSAAHLQGGPVPVTVRFSDGTGNPQIPDANPNAAPHGMAVRFTLPGAFTDIVANSHNGFFVGTGEDSLAFLKAIAATTPQSPHPSPIESFLESHPRALKVVVDSKLPPASRRPRSSATTPSSSSTAGEPSGPAATRSSPWPEWPTWTLPPRPRPRRTTCSTSCRSGSPRAR